MVPVTGKIAINWPYKKQHLSVININYSYVLIMKFNYA